jgi:hypothetical protein
MSFCNLLDPFRRTADEVSTERVSFDVTANHVKMLVAGNGKTLEWPLI